MSESSSSSGASSGITPAPVTTGTSNTASNEDPTPEEAAAKAGAPLAAFSSEGDDAETREAAGSRTEGEDPAADESRFIYVKSGRADDSVAIYERSTDHPDGEIFVGPGDVVKAAKTTGVMGRLASGDLVETDEAEATEVENARKEEDARRRKYVANPFASPFATPSAPPE